MNIIQAVILGIVQGATEFIPVSSSAHLVLVPWLFGWPSPGLAFDTVLHLGTLLAVLTVFRRDFLALASAWCSSLAGLWSSQNKSALSAEVAGRARLAWWIVLATIPAALMGVLWEDQFEALFHSALRVAFLLLVTGLWLAFTERQARRQRQAEEMSWWQALLVGLAQGCAIAPGISRSGATIGAGLLLGLRREAATRFSFLLSAPIIIGAGLLQIKRILESSNLEGKLLPLTLGFLAAFCSGYVCIRFLLAYVKRRSVAVFAIYCWLAGLACIAVYLLR